MSSIYHLRGRIGAVKPPYTLTNGRVVREVIVEQEVETTHRIQPVPIHFSGRNADLAERLGIGDLVDIGFGVAGRVYHAADGTSRHAVRLYGLSVDIILADKIISGSEAVR